MLLKIIVPGRENIAVCYVLITEYITCTLISLGIPKK